MAATILQCRDWETQGATKMSDLKLIEEGNGGDFVLIGNDIALIDGFQNMPYLGMFGGNPEGSTGDVNTGEQRFDWWGNTVFFDNQSGLQFNSQLEDILRRVALTSSGRLQIEQTAKKDLEFMKDFASIDVAVSLVSDDRIEIAVSVQKPDNLESTNFVYLWDATAQELTNN